MPVENTIVSKASEFVYRLFEERLADYLVYHTFDHTQMVARTARKIGEAMALGEEGIEAVELAALFHDTGYTELYKGHEEVSIRIAEEFLRRENYPEKKIRLIAGCIRATKIPQQPKNILEEIIADADLSGFGRRSFFKKSEILHLEWERALDKKYSEEEWIEQNLEMLTGHTYFTSYAKRTFAEQKAENIQLLYKKLKEIQDRKEIVHVPEFPSEKPYFNKSLLLPEYLPREEPAFEGDKKAQTLIIVNTLIVLILFTFILGRRSPLSDFRETIPIFLLLAVAVVTIVFAILAIRPDAGNILHNQKRNTFLRTGLTIFMYGVSISAALLLLFSFVKHF